MATYTDPRSQQIARNLGTRIAEWADRNAADWVMDGLADASRIERGPKAGQRVCDGAALQVLPGDIRPKQRMVRLPLDWQRPAIYQAHEFEATVGQDVFRAYRHRTEYGWSWFEITCNGKPSQINIGRQGELPAYVEQWQPVEAAKCGTCGGRHETAACPYRFGGPNYDHNSTPDGV